MSTRHIRSLTPFDVCTSSVLIFVIVVVVVLVSSPSTISITTKLLLLLFEFSTELTAFSSCLSMISFRTLSRLCLSLTNSANKLVSGILLLILIFLVGVGERAVLGDESIPMKR